MIATEDTSEQRSDGWHTIRAGRATASKFASIMTGGTGAETYKAELVGEIIGGYVNETYQSRAMLDGIEREAMARLKYSLRTGNAVIECGFFAHNSLKCGASPDGLVGQDGLVELKSPIEKTHLATLHTGKIPNQYYWQMMGQMWMTERKWCDYVSFHPKFGNASLFVKRVYRDDTDIADLENAVSKFLSDVEREVAFARQYNGKSDEVIVTRISK